MEIYVQSAGVSEQQDYSWQKITEDSQKSVDEPRLVKKFKCLLQTEAPSIFLGYESNDLILLVTGMKASKRKDYRGRTIRNSLALIAKDTEENEQKIRGIAILALNGELDNYIDLAIKQGGECGFEVSWKEIINIISSLPSINNNTPTKRYLIGKNLEKNKKILADTLAQECLPNREKESEVLVVVTGIKTENALKKVGVWRGLSNLVEKENFSPYEPKKNSPGGIDGQEEANIKLARKILIALSLIVLLATLMVVLKSFNYAAQKYSSAPLAVISLGGQYVAFNDAKGQMLVKNIQDQSISPLKHDAPVKSIAISSDGNYVVTGDQSGKVQLWDVNGKKRIDITSNNNVNFKHETAVVSVAINIANIPNQQTTTVKIVSGDVNGKVLLWKGNVKDYKGKGSTEKLFP